MKQTWSIINNFCKINNKDVNITLKINETIITDTQVIVDKFNIFFSKIGDQVISELEKNNNVNVSSNIILLIQRMQDSNSKRCQSIPLCN